MGNTYLDPEKHFQEQNERLLADCDGHESTRIAGSHPKRSKTIIAKAKQACYLLTLATSLGLLLYCAITLHSFTQSADATKTQLFPTPNTAKNQSLNVTIVASCGDSIPEARALGCFFDAMTFQWYPPACADPDLSAEVIQSYDWRFYTRERGWDEDRVPVGAVATGKHPYLYVPMVSLFHLAKEVRARSKIRVCRISISIIARICGKRCIGRFCTTNCLMKI